MDGDGLRPDVWGERPWQYPPIPRPDGTGADPVQVQRRARRRWLLTAVVLALPVQVALPMDWSWALQVVRQPVTLAGVAVVLAPPALGSGVGVLAARRRPDRRDPPVWAATGALVGAVLIVALLALAYYALVQALKGWTF